MIEISDLNGKIYQLEQKITQLEGNYNHVCNILNQYYEKTNNLEQQINNNILQYFINNAQQLQVPMPIQQIQPMHQVQAITPIYSPSQVPNFGFFQHANQPNQYY